jgi:O-antigen/teichoic acid export membrane protein
MAAPLVSIPIALHALGADRFGILALGWLVLGWFAISDIGIGRATTHLLATAIASNDRSRTAPIVAGSFAAQLMLGFFGGVVLALGSRVLMPNWSGVPAELRAEAGDMLVVLSLGVPVSLAMAAGRSVLEGQQRFGVVNAIAGPVGVFTYLVAAVGASLGLSLSTIAALLVLERLIGVCAYVVVIARSGIAAPLARPSASMILDLIAYGRWVAGASITAPLVVYADRFIVSGILGVAALGRYSPPFDAITRLWVFPSAVSNALFPYFSGARARADVGLYRHYWTALTAILLAMASPAILLIALGPELLGVWLGSAFAAETGRLVPVIAVGAFVGALGYVPVALLQASGRPDLSVKLQLAELIPFIVVTVLLVDEFGAPGAAVAWTTRSSIDLVGNLIIAERLLPELTRGTARRQFIDCALAVSALVGLVALLSAALASSPFQRSIVAAFAFAILIALLARSWRSVRAAPQ